MKYAGPRMIFRHPVSAIRHLLGMLKKPSESVFDRKSSS
jgi:Nitrous oxide-stimulated promoter